MGSPSSDAIKTVVLRTFGPLEQSDNNGLMSRPPRADTDSSEDVLEANECCCSMDTPAEHDCYSFWLGKPLIKHRSR